MFYFATHLSGCIWLWVWVWVWVWACLWVYVYAIKNKKKHFLQNKCTHADTHKESRLHTHACILMVAIIIRTIFIYFSHFFIILLNFYSFLFHIIGHWPYMCVLVIVWVFVATFNIVIVVVVVLLICFYCRFLFSVNVYYYVWKAIKSKTFCSTFDQNADLALAKMAGKCLHGRPNKGAALCPAIFNWSLHSHSLTCRVKSNELSKKPKNKRTQISK